MCERLSASLAVAGSGIAAVIEIASSGLVPHVIIGASVAASSVTSRSKRAPASVGNDCQNKSALSHISPRGVNSRPARYAYVLSSGAMVIVYVLPA